MEDYIDMSSKHNTHKNLVTKNFSFTLYSPPISSYSIIYPLKVELLDAEQIVYKKMQTPGCRGATWRRDTLFKEFICSL